MEDSELIARKEAQQFVDLVEHVHALVRNAENYVYGIFKQADNNPERQRRLDEALRLMSKAKQLLNSSNM